MASIFSNTDKAAEEILRSKRAVLQQQIDAIDLLLGAEPGNGSQVRLFAEPVFRARNDMVQNREHAVADPNLIPAVRELLAKHSRLSTQEIVLLLMQSGYEFPEAITAPGRAVGIALSNAFRKGLFKREGNVYSLVE